MIQTNAMLLDGSPYASYAYAYPHKTAYRPLTPPVPLRELWAGEDKSALFLYFHVPFCEMRCGFCNLFTTPNPPDDWEAAYLDALERQVRQVADAVGPTAARYARMAFGGGTPTFLSASGLARLLDLADAVRGPGRDAAPIPLSVETSPRTATPEKLNLLRERGADRVSIGVQSFVESEVAAIGRAQKAALVEQALATIRDARLPTLNIDLMYGLPGQTRATWEASLRAALRWRSEEIYIYPLYVRPLTGMDRSPRDWDDDRLALYRDACALLCGEGYEQVSMRLFRAPHAPPETAGEGPVYCCQEDNMVGLGCGARSYTRTLHYSSEYAVGRAGVKSILADFIGRTDEAFAVADYGIRLAPEDQRRRYVLYTLLMAAGLDLAAYCRRFGSDALDDLPQLRELPARGLAVRAPGSLRLTAAGLERSDAIGPWLYSTGMAARMETFDLV